MTWRSVEIGGRTGGWSARPVVGAGVIALACAHERRDGIVPVVAVHDVDGSRAFTIPFAASGMPVEPSEPAIGPDGVVRALVYEHDVGLTCVAAQVDGGRLPSTNLGDGYPIRAADLAPKLMTRLAACAGGFLASYAYRQVRHYFLARYRDGDPAPRWACDEWLLATTPDVALATTPPSRSGRGDGPAERVVARAVADGRILWEHAGADLDVAAATDDGFLVVDRRARVAEVQALRAAADAAFEAERLDEPAWHAVYDRWPAGPTHVRLVDAHTGADRWCVEVPDEVFAATPTPAGVVVMTRDQHGRGQLLGVDGGGEAGAGAGTTTALVANPSPAWPPSNLSAPMLVGHADGVTVWADDVRLHAARDLVLPGPIDGFHPRMRDRGLTKPNATIAHGHVYARIGATLYIAEL